LFYIAFRLGLLSHPMLGPDWQQVQTLLPSLEPARARKLAKILAGRRAANAFLKRAVQTLGHERLKPWVQIEGEEHLRDLLERNVPVVLAPWHFGPLFAIGTALIKMDVPVLVLQRWPRKQQGSHIEYLHFEGSAASRVQTLKRGVQRLHGGGVVMTVVDVPTNETPEIPGPYPLLGRDVDLLEGAATLARIGRAAVIPVSARWQGNKAIVQFAPPVATPEDAPTETDIQTALATWWEREIIRRPEELWPLSLRAINRAPHITPEASRPPSAPDP